MAISGNKWKSSSQKHEESSYFANFNHELDNLMIIIVDGDWRYEGNLLQEWLHLDIVMVELKSYPKKMSWGKLKCTREKYSKMKSMKVHVEKKRLKQDEGNARLVFMRWQGKRRKKNKNRKVVVIFLCTQSAIKQWKFQGHYFENVFLHIPNFKSFGQREKTGKETLSPDLMVRVHCISAVRFKL